MVITKSHFVRQNYFPSTALKFLNHRVMSSEIKFYDAFVPIYEFYKTTEYINSL